MVLASITLMKMLPRRHFCCEPNSSWFLFLFCRTTGYYILHVLRSVPYLISLPLSSFGFSRLYFGGECPNAPIILYYFATTVLWMFRNLRGSMEHMIVWKFSCWRPSALCILQFGMTWIWFLIAFVYPKHILEDTPLPPHFVETTRILDSHSHFYY